MSLLVHVTDRCWADARRHGFLGALEKLRQHVEDTQSTSGFDNFPAPYLVKKKFGNYQGRLIAAHHAVGEHGVVVFLAILLRGNAEYESGFAVDAAAYGAVHFRNLVSADALASFVAERTALPAASPKLRPTGDELAFLFGAFSHRGGSSEDDLVFETDRWIEKVNSPGMAGLLSVWNRPCIDALGKQPGLNEVALDNPSGWSLWSAREAGRLVLLTPSRPEDAQESRRYAETTYNQLRTGAASPFQMFRRAYPSLVMADLQLWTELETDRVANMALSPEESELLEITRHSQSPFPLFINGRAGSGKSTILQYLFADLLFHCLSRAGGDTGVAPPLYLTANAELLRVARNFVERLLRAEASFSQEDAGRLVNAHESLVRDSFAVFRPHLLGLVPAELRSQKFRESGYVDHPRFRGLWLEKYGQATRGNQVPGPDLAWHVIRTFIKGMSVDGPLDPDDYGALTDNQRMVSRAGFQSVFETVWRWYDELQKKEGLWDDQDLAEFVLRNELIGPSHSAVFCDEAQDFTRLELELILRMSLFSDRDVAGNEISRVPFAFAGDQFQTLNPTGFRWEAIKSSFVEKFIFSMDPSRRSGRTDLNYRALQYNYRSTDAIVRFTNLVQALRAVLFEIPDLTPQIPWRATEPCSPVLFFKATDRAFWESFKANCNEYVIIVPCGEGEEAGFVRKDPFLAENVPHDEGVPRNVLSPSRAKGCEYSKVVVYGFGEDEWGEIGPQLSSDERWSDNDTALPMQYFVNRLYVAVSRARHSLVVVESEKGYRRLWSHIENMAAADAIVARVKNAHAWKDTARPFVEGAVEDLASGEPVDPLINGRAFESEGLARRDPYLLRQASSAFRRAGDSTRATLCMAWALEFEEQLLQAGEAFGEAGATDDQVRCLWAAGMPGWRKLAAASFDRKDDGTRLQVVWAAALAGPSPKSPQDVFALISRLLSELSDPSFRDACLADAEWVHALDVLLGATLAWRNDDPFAGKVSEALARLEQAGIRPSTVVTAEFYARIGRFHDVLSLLEGTEHVRSKTYLLARSEVDPYPERLRPLRDLKDYVRILEEHSRNPQVKLVTADAELVADAMTRLERRSEAGHLLAESGSLESLVGVTLSSIGKKDATLSAQLLGFLAGRMVRESRWDPVQRFMESGVFRPSEDWATPEVQGAIRPARSALNVALVQAFAQHPDLRALPPAFLRSVVDFLDRPKVQDLWPSALTAGEVGAAIEKAGQWTSALRFYERVEKQGNNEEKTLARRRWLVNKRRQADGERRPERAQQLEEEFRARQPLWAPGGLKQEPEYPDSQLRTSRIPEPQSEHRMETPPAVRESKIALAQVGDLTLQIARPARRCNLTHQKTLETGFIIGNEKRCGGEGGVEEVRADAWRFRSWGVDVQFVNAPAPAIRLHFRDLGLDLVILD